MRFFRFVNSLRNGLWFVPVACVLLGVVLSLATTVVDRRADFELIPPELTGGPDAALAILATVAASMLSLAALVLTITMVVVQLAMGQFSPRIVQRILRDKPSQLAIGIFVATFAHAMLAMREVKFEEPMQVPGLAILVAFVMVLISIAVLVIYVNHIGQALRVASLIELVGRDMRTLLDEQYPDPGAPMELGDDQQVVAPTSGVVSHIDHDRLVEEARRADTTLNMIPFLGEFVPAGGPIFEVDPPSLTLEDGDVTDCVVLSLERTLEQDVSYGIRLLVDIAERSLADSPFQDPTTAVQAIDRIHDCLRQLVRRPFPSGDRRDEDGIVRLRVPTLSWDDYVHLAFDEVRLAGAGSPQVARRLNAAIADLVTIAPPERRAILEDQRSRLRRSSEERLETAEDRAEALQGDKQGIGGSSR